MLLPFLHQRACNGDPLLLSAGQGFGTLQRELGSVKAFQRQYGHRAFGLAKALEQRR